MAGENSFPNIKVNAADIRFGDFASNIALECAKTLKQKPITIAEQIRDKILDLHQDDIQTVEVAGPGFINFELSDSLRRQGIQHIIERSTSPSFDFPELEKINSGKKIHLEYVSANPTGPLHVGHGRWAVIGSVLAKILRTTGYHVHEEFYINDTGKQIEKLKESIEAVRNSNPVPEDGYHGKYIHELVHGNEDPVSAILTDQKQVLESSGTFMNEFYSENSLRTQGMVDETLDTLKKNDLAYQKDGAWWFPSSRLGDDKDRVLIKSNGEVTYFCVDIAYHYSKVRRGYNHLIDVLGADHHGYVKRIQGAVQLISQGKASLNVIIGQLVSVLRSGKPVRMSKRSGDIVELKEVVDEIGMDAFRYFFSMRHPQMPLEFDIEVAKTRNINNPVFYIQYCHARIFSLQKKATSLNIPKMDINDFNFATISNPITKSILNKLVGWEEEILQVSESYEIQQINNYLYELSTLFHRYYNQETFLSDKNPEEQKLTGQRLIFLQAIDQIIKEGLSLLGISYPDIM